MEYHKYADIFPMMGEEDYENLKKDLSENGFDRTRPIFLFEGKILDGRNRYKACGELNIEPFFENYEGDNPVAFVVSANLNRRHLTASQRATISTEAMPYLEEEAKKRQAGGQGGILLSPNLDRARATEQAGKMFGVGKTYVSDAKFLKEKDPELFEQVKKGEKNLNEAVSKLKKQERIKKIKEEVKDYDVGISSLVIKGECLQTIPQLKGNSIACLIIDPPYGIDFQSNHKLAKYEKIKDDDAGAFELLDKSLELVKPKLLPDAHVYIFTSWKVFELVKPIVAKHFEVKNALIWNKNNWSMGDLDGNYAEKYEMIVFATQGNRKLLGEKRPVNVLDFPRTANTKHPTEKPVELLKELIKNSTVEGEMVLDYFAGSGSTLIASKLLNRKAVAIEIDEDNINMLKKRIKDLEALK